MEITFIGVGEACDPHYPNTSLLLRDSATILFDCGYSVVHNIWNTLKDPNEIDAIYISHAHADHYFGLPILFLKMWEAQRTNPIVIITQSHIKEKIEQLLELGYEGFRAQFKFDIDFIEVSKVDDLMFEGLTLRFAPTEHFVPNLAIRVEADGKSFCYSGDGRFTNEAIALFSGADVVAHEAFKVQDDIEGHGSMKACIEMAENAAIKSLALIHVQHSERKKGDEIKQLMISTNVHAFMPEPGQQITL